MQTLDELKHNCRHFKGYMPCKFAKANEGLDCWNCKDKYSAYTKKILIIKQGEIGDVLRTTPILRELKKKWPECYITWLVQDKAVQFVLNNKYIDEVVIYHPSQLLRFMLERFDLVICLDKDIASTTVATLSNAEKKLGFGFSSTGTVFPFNEQANYKYLIGVSDTINKKNKLSYIQQIYDIIGIKSTDYRYLFDLPENSAKFQKIFTKCNWIRKDDIIIGINHGCGFKLRMRLWPVKHYVDLCRRLLNTDVRIKIFILGGRLEQDRQDKIYNRLYDTVKNKTDKYGHPRIINTGTNHNILDFCGILNICDIIVTSVTMSLHIAIALKKKVVTMMGPIPKPEIDTFGLGPIITSNKKCLGCFKDECNITPSCMEEILPYRVYNAVMFHVKKCRK